MSSDCESACAMFSVLGSRDTAAVHSVGSQRSLHTDGAAMLSVSPLHVIDDVTPDVTSQLPATSSAHTVTRRHRRGQSLISLRRLLSARIFGLSYSVRSKSD